MHICLNEKISLLKMHENDWKDYFSYASLTVATSTVVDISGFNAAYWNLGWDLRYPQWHGKTVKNHFKN